MTSKRFRNTDGVGGQAALSHILPKTLRIDGAIAGGYCRGYCTPVKVNFHTRRMGAFDMRQILVEWTWRPGDAPRDRYDGSTGAQTKTARRNGAELEGCS